MILISSFSVSASSLQTHNNLHQDVNQISTLEPNLLHNFYAANVPMYHAHTRTLGRMSHGTHLGREAFSVANNGNQMLPASLVPQPNYRYSTMSRVRISARNQEPLTRQISLPTEEQAPPLAFYEPHLGDNHQQI